MWKQGDSRRENVADCEKKNHEKSNQQDSGIVDSGFLSSDGNIIVSEDFSAGKEATGLAGSGESDGKFFSASNETPETKPMRADSGLDLGLSESLSRLSIEQPDHLNPLGRGKVQSEPIVELKPITAKIQDVRNQRNNQQQPQTQQYCREPWELYYTQDDEGDTLLHMAIIQGFLEAAFSLIRMAPHPCLLNILNDDCQGPLHLAVLTRQPRIARRLILAGADPTIRDFRGNTPLHVACASGDIACAKALTDSLSTIERNFLANSKRVPALPQDLEQPNYDGEMCLHVAASGDQVDLVQHLLRLGADLEAREGLAGRTALHIALERRCNTVLNFLLQECRPYLDAPTYGGMTAYQIAICIDGRLARELVRLGAKPEPLPQSDSDMSDDEGEEDASYIPAIARLRQGVCVRA